MVAGTIEKSTGSRDLARLGGLRKAMPLTFAGAVIAAISMAGVPPSLGFLSKELLYSAGFLPATAPFVLVATFAAAVAVASVAVLITAVPFGGRLRDLPTAPQEVHWGLWIGPVTLGAAAIYSGLWPESAFTYLLVPAVTAVTGHRPHFEQAPWASTPEALTLSAVTLTAAFVIYWQRSAIIGLLRRSVALLPLTGDRAYDRAMEGLAAVAEWQTRRLQSGIQRRYLRIVFATLGLSLAATLWIKDAIAWPTAWPRATFLEWSLAALIAASAIATIRTKSRLAAICALGVVGTGTALIFLVFGAPDLAMTQLIVETLTTVLVAIVLLKLPSFRKEIWPSKTTQVRDALIAATVGISTTLVLLGVTAAPPQPELREYFERTAVPGAHGRNIVNVILVDFRALDTMGEISVLAIAGAAVFALLLPSTRRRLAAGLIIGSQSARPKPAGRRGSR